jgi:hypothetical protein
MKWLSAIIVIVCGGVAAGQTLKPQDHPNHFIVLVDGSGSAIQTKNKQTNYLHVLREVLPEHLFNTGFGNSIPPYDPERDALTVERFGIIEGETSQVFQKLAHADFLRQYIHLVGSAVDHPTESQFLALVSRPEPHYRYTVLSWCRELGLSNVKSYTQGRLFGRTFIVVVDDGITNGSDARQEVSETRRWGDPDIVGRTETITDGIASTYDFVPVKTVTRAGSESDGEALLLRVGQGSESIFVESYEVIAKNLSDWQARANRIQPFTSFRSSRTLRPDQLLLQGEFSPEFISWLRSGETTEVRLAAGGESETLTPDGSPFRLKVNTPQSCHPGPMVASLDTSLVQRDSVLGNRILAFSYNHTFSVPEPVRCTAWWYVRLGTVTSLCVMTIGSIAVLALFSFLVVPLTVRIPGHRAVWLRRRGIAHLTADNPPRTGSSAFEFRLPPRTIRMLLCRGILLRITSVQTAEGPVLGLEWEDGSESISVGSHVSNKIVGFWKTAPAAAVTVTISLGDGDRTVLLKLSYPKRSATMSIEGSTETTGHSVEDEPGNIGEPNNREKPTHLVALDLGSESMAAYYRVVQGGERHGMIPLQHYAGKLLKDGNPVLLTEEGTKTSPRLRTRFSLRDNQEESRQTSLRFVGKGKPDQEEYNKSVFEFFRPQFGSLSKSLPNPKIIFQRGAQNAIPEVMTLGGHEPKSFRPEEVIHWLTVQVVNNFVLEAPELKDVPRSRIELILTVPNVYSVTHVESLRRFVAEHTTVGAVRTIFESDAIAAYATDVSENKKGQNIDGGSFFQQLVKAQNSGIPIELATFDMGRGTTDLSIVTFEGPRTLPGVPESGRWQHFQKARTGRSDGGNKLNYLFVQYFERTVAAAFMAANVKRPYSFTSRSGALPSEEQVSGLQVLETYIEGIKSRISPGYSLSEDDELLRLRSVATDEIARGTEGLRGPIKQALTLPKRLKNSFWRAVLRRMPRLRKAGFERVQNEAQGVLVRALETYVDDNVTRLVSDVKAMAEEYEMHARSRGSASKSAVLGGVAHSTRRFAVIAGRAAQFGPVEGTILRALNDKLQIPPSRVQFLRGGAAKECCCRGAVGFYANAFDSMNVDHLHGTYGVIAGKFRLVPDQIPVWEIRNGEFEKLLPDGTHEFLFSPKPFKNVGDLSTDDSWTSLCTFQGTRMGLLYDARTRELKLNGSPVVLEPFGEQKLEELYARLWPEFLPGRADLSGAGGSDAVT